MRSDAPLRLAISSRATVLRERHTRAHPRAAWLAHFDAASTGRDHQADLDATLGALV